MELKVSEEKKSIFFFFEILESTRKEMMKQKFNLIGIMIWKQPQTL
jgi:hypothetical protein